MSNLQEKIDYFVRDVCSVGYNSKSAVRKNLKELLDDSYHAGIKACLEVMETGIKELDGNGGAFGTPTILIIATISDLHTAIEALLTKEKE